MRCRPAPPALLPLLLSLFVWLMPASGAEAQSRLGVIGDILPPAGTEGTWTYRNDGDVFAMANAEIPDDIRYFYANLTDNAGAAFGPWRITADVTILSSEGELGSGGLVYGLNPETGQYYLALLDGRGGLSVLRRTGSGFDRLVDVELPVWFSGPNRLEVSAAGMEYTLHVNGDNILGHDIGTIPEGTAAPQSGGFGVAGVGLVEVSFTNVFLVN